MVPVLGTPFDTATCDVHAAVVLNRRGECPSCYVSNVAGKPSRPGRIACPTCGDTRKPGRHGCFGCYANRRKQECGQDYNARGIATAIAVQPPVSPVPSALCEDYNTFDLGLEYGDLVNSPDGYIPPCPVDLAGISG